MSNSRVNELEIQLNRINDEIGRLNEKLKNLRETKKRMENTLYKNMRATRIEKAGKYTLKKLEKNYGTAEDKRRRTAQEKREEACELCWEVGIVDPQEFITKFKKTQRTYEKSN